MTTLAHDIEVIRAVSVRFSESSLVVELADGRSISVPLSWYPRLVYATRAERADWRLIGDGQGIHWPDIEDDISVESLLAGRRSHEHAASLERWLAGRTV